MCLTSCLSNSQKALWATDDVVSRSPTTGVSAPTIPDIGLGVNHQLYVRPINRLDSDLLVR